MPDSIAAPPGKGHVGGVIYFRGVIFAARDGMIWRLGDKEWVPVTIEKERLAETRPDCLDLVTLVDDQ